MDLREKPGVMQRIGEYAVRFRLILLLILVAVWVFFAASWSDFIAMLLACANENGKMIFSALQGDISLRSLLLGPLFVVILLLLVRGNFFGWRNGLLWLGCVFSAAGLLFLLDGSKPYIAFVVMAVAVVAVTLLFFVRSLVAISLFPFMLLAYGLSSWLMGLGIHTVGWQIFMALFLADVLAMLASVGQDLRSGRPVAGAVAGCLRSHYPMILVSSMAILVAEAFFMYMAVPLLLSDRWLVSLGLVASYVLWVPVAVVPVLSLSPLGRLRSQQRSLMN